MMSTTYKSTTDRAKEIRDTLKRKYGWTSRQVSVRREYFSMGSSIDVVIKDPTIPIKPVEEIANAHEDISRDEYTGEILSGGNRYVHVAYDSDALRSRASAYLPGVEAALAQANGSSLIPVEGTKYMVGRDQFDRPTLWGDTFLHTGYDAQSIANHIACLIGS